MSWRPGSAVPKNLRTYNSYWPSMTHTGTHTYLMLHGRFYQHLHKQKYPVLLVNLPAPWVAYHRHHGSTQLWSVLLLGITWSNGPFTHALFVRWRDKSCWTKFSLFVLIQIIDGWLINSYSLLNIVYKKHHVYVNLVIAIEKNTTLHFPAGGFSRLTLRLIEKVITMLFGWIILDFPGFIVIRLFLKAQISKNPPWHFMAKPHSVRRRRPGLQRHLRQHHEVKRLHQWGYLKILWMVYFMENPVKMIQDVLGGNSIYGNLRILDYFAISRKKTILLTDIHEWDWWLCNN